MQKILASDGLILTFFSGGDAQGARSFTGAPPPLGTAPVVESRPYADTDTDTYRQTDTLKTIPALAIADGNYI